MLKKIFTEAPGLSMILATGLVVEGANFQNMFYRFMSVYRPDWGPINQVLALFLAGFLLMNIVVWGIKGKSTYSWTFAVLAIVVSFSVYARIELSWSWETVSEIHLVVVILSVVLPIVVALTTHNIYEECFAKKDVAWKIDESIFAKVPPPPPPAPARYPHHEDFSPGGLYFEKIKNGTPVEKKKTI